ncbi:hypothetical protein EI94DRAFT_479978 [Lactarius quietus]|nr:hypothetical protein EI94DRAFT_479978 [Lactarius quietus]
MDASGIPVSTGSMAFSYILLYLDGIFDVLILFTVLRVLGHAVKSPNNTVSSDPEKGKSKRAPISRPTYDWNPQSTFAPPSQAQMKRTAPPAHPPSTMLQVSDPRPLFLGRSLFQPRKMTRSTDSTTHLLTPEPLSRSHSPSLSLDGSQILVTTTVVQKPPVPPSVLDVELSFPPSAIQKHTETGPLQLVTADHPQNVLTSYSPPRHSRISSGLSPIPESSSIPQSAASFQEVTLHSPTANRPPTTDGIGSFLSFYLSRRSPESLDPPPLPDPAVPRGSSAGLHLTGYVPPARRVPAASSVGAHAVTLHDGVISPPQAALSIDAVGSGYGRRRSSTVTSDSPPAPTVSPADSTDRSQYSDTEDEIPPPAPLKPLPSPLPSLPALQPTQPLRFSRVAMVNARPSTSSEHRSLDSPWTPLGRRVPRALPKPPSQLGGQRSPSIYSQASSTIWTHSRQGSSSSSLSGYI